MYPGIVLHRGERLAQGIFVVRVSLRLFKPWLAARISGLTLQEQAVRNLEKDTDHLCRGNVI
jgi:hypothetical protein